MTRDSSGLMGAGVVAGGWGVREIYRKRSKFKGSEARIKSACLRNGVAGAASTKS